MGRWTRGAALKAAAIRLAGNMLTDGQALRAAAVFMPWDADKTYREGERARFGGRLYRCLQNHDAQAGWTPDAAPSLWTRITDPGDEWPEWVSPQGAHDAYALGAKVAHGGKRWISTLENNVWEPGGYGWEEAIG